MGNDEGIVRPSLTTSFGRRPREWTCAQAHPGLDCHSLEDGCRRGDSTQRLLDKLFGNVARWEQFLIGRTPHTDPKALLSEKNAKAIAKQTKKGGVIEQERRCIEPVNQVYVIFRRSPQTLDKPRATCRMGQHEWFLPGWKTATVEGVALEAIVKRRKKAEIFADMLLCELAGLDRDLIRSALKLLSMYLTTEIDAKGVVQKQTMQLSGHTSFGLIEKLVEKQVIVRASTEQASRRASVIIGMSHVIPSNPSGRQTALEIRSRV